MESNDKNILKFTSYSMLGLTVLPSQRSVCIVSSEGLVSEMHKYTKILSKSVETMAKNAWQNISTPTMSNLYAPSYVLLINYYGPLMVTPSHLILDLFLKARTAK